MSNNQEVPAMSRKHFQIIADSIVVIEDTEARRVAATALADSLGRLYPRFDRRRFILACGVSL